MISPSGGGVNPNRPGMRRGCAPRPWRRRPHVVAVRPLASIPRAGGAGRPEGVPTPVIPGHPRSHPTHDLPGLSWESPAIKGNRRTRPGTAAEGVAGGTLGGGMAPDGSGGGPVHFARSLALCYCGTRNLLLRIIQSVENVPPRRVLSLPPRFTRPWRMKGRRRTGGPSRQPRAVCEAFRSCCCGFSRRSEGQLADFHSAPTDGDRPLITPET
jgi:hypothetical protein